MTAVAGPVELRIDGARADIVLRRPEVLNAIDWDVFDGLAKAAGEIAGHADVRVVVVSGEGRSFSSGIDTTSFGALAGNPESMVARAQAGYRALTAVTVPTIAKVQGHAFGAGLQLALACDLRIVAEDAQLGLLEARFGLIPDLGGTQRLPGLIGPGRAKKMIWLAERISGAEAARIGLAEVVVPADRLDETTDELVNRLAQAPPIAVRAAKTLVDLSGRVELPAGMDAEASAQKDILTTSDVAEAVSAFMERRDPHFQGR